MNARPWARPDCWCAAIVPCSQRDTPGQLWGADHPWCWDEPGSRGAEEMPDVQ